MTPNCRDIAYFQVVFKASEKLGDLLKESESEVEEEKVCSNFGRWWRKFDGDNAMKVDVVSRTLFPAAFVLFNCVYWIVYLDLI